MPDRDEYEAIKTRDSSDEYEIVPVTPLRRLEKRLERLESTRSTDSIERLMDKIIDMVELNQRIVDEMVKANTTLREDISTLVTKIDKLSDNLVNFIEIIEEAGKEEAEDSQVIIAVKNMIKPLIENIQQTNENLIKTNEGILNGLSTLDKRLKRLQTTQEALLGAQAGGGPPAPAPGGAPAPGLPGTNQQQSPLKF